MDLTKQKLELTRLPHELAEPKSTLWWEPKPQVEPLIDFWYVHCLVADLLIDTGLNLSLAG